jgi:hypothetical protein
MRRAEDDSRHCTERMRKGAAVPIAGLRWFYRSVRGSIGAAAIVLTFDVVLSGSILMSYVLCPIWILVSLLKSAIQRPGWGLTLVRILIPTLTFWLVKANNAFQLRVAETHGHRIVAACEEYHAANGHFPGDLHELVPKYMNSVPVAKYCLGPGSRFFYTSSSSGPTMLAWEIVAPHYRRIYNFETRRWSYLD